MYASDAPDRILAFNVHDASAGVPAQGSQVIIGTDPRRRTASRSAALNADFQPPHNAYQCTSAIRPAPSCSYASRELKRSGTSGRYTPMASEGALSPWSAWASI